MPADLSSASLEGESSRQTPARPVAATVRRVTAIAMALAGFVLFLLALRLLSVGAVGIASLFRVLHVGGAANYVGFGWLAAYVALSGSPVAAMSLTLLGGGVATPLEAFAAINGSRLGASFIVLFTGFIYYLRGLRGRGVVSMGVLSMLTTATTYLPAMLLGSLILQRGWIAGLHFGTPGSIRSVLDAIYGPVTNWLRGFLPPWGLFVGGFFTLLVAFRLFASVMAPIESNQLQRRYKGWLYHPATMFALGLLVTSFTLSVSVSLSILVPLAASGFVQRRDVIPYIMGANVSTFVDTLFASLLILAPEAFTIVLTIMGCVALISALILLLFYRPYQEALLAVNRLVTSSRVGFAAFVVTIALVPLLLLIL